MWKGRRDERGELLRRLSEQSRGDVKKQMATRKMCESEGERERARLSEKSGEEKCTEEIYLESASERRGESYSLAARGMTHLLPADRRTDGWVEEEREERGRGGE